MMESPPPEGRAGIHIEELDSLDNTFPARETQGDDDFIVDEADVPHPIFDSPAWHQMAAMCHRRARPLTKAERRRAAAIPSFDDPEFEAKLHTDAAPLAERVRLFVRLWRSFDPGIRAEFLEDIGISKRAG